MKTFPKHQQAPAPLTQEEQYALVVALLLQSLEVNEMMREAMTAAARLMQDCKCQNQRRQESLAAVDLADAAIDRLHALNTAIVKLLPDTLPQIGVIQ